MKELLIEAFPARAKLWVSNENEFDEGVLSLFQAIFGQKEFHRMNLTVFILIA